MKNELHFCSFGISEKDLENLAKIGIRHDKRSRAAYLSEFSAPSVVKNEDIENFEVALSAPIPNDYRDFLLTKNGGKPNKDTVFIKEYGWTTIQHFSPLVCRISSITIKQLIDVTYKGRMPRSHLPIATTPGGSWFILSLENDSYGKVYFWDHEHESDTINLLSVADCFSDFLSLLKDAEANACNQKGRSE